MSTFRLKQFFVDIGRSRELIGLGESISGITYGSVDAVDIYRAALVQAVASLDSYVRGVVLDYGVDVLCGRRQPGSRTKIGLHFGAVRDLVGAPTESELELRAHTHVAECLEKVTFQRPDDIARAFAMIGIPKLWSSAFGDGAGRVTTALGVVVNRRNQIVHSCDVDPLDNSVRPLSASDALSASRTIEGVVLGIDAIV